MKESHRKGVATHPDPESCVASRKATTEALTGTRASRSRATEAARRGQAGDVRLPRVHARVWHHAENRPVHRQAPDYPQTSLSQAPRAEGGTPASVAHASPATRAVVTLGGARLVQLPRGAGQHGQSERVPQPGPPALVPRPSASGPAPTADLGSLSSSRSALAPECQDSASASERALRRYTSKVGAVCSNPARTVLCGGRRVTVVPTATQVFRRCDGSEKGVGSLFPAPNLEEKDSRPLFPHVHHGLLQPEPTYTTGC